MYLESNFIIVDQILIKLKQIKAESREDLENQINECLVDVPEKYEIWTVDFPGNIMWYGMIKLHNFNIVFTLDGFSYKIRDAWTVLTYYNLI